MPAGAEMQPCFVRMVISAQVGKAYKLIDRAAKAQIFQR